MAGSTLLAFNNGATDVITALVAGGSGDGGDDDLAVGALFGASTFAICIILGVVIYTTPDKLLKDLKRGNLVRDISTYLIAILTFIIIGMFHTSYSLIGTILVTIYLVYVLLV
jgi:Ca2+/Na+ antiporter